MIPAHRQAIAGRTWSQCWEPRAIEVHRRSRVSRLDRVLGVLLAIAIALTLAALSLHELGALL